MIFNLENEDLIRIIKTSEQEDLTALCDDIRSFLVDKVSRTGGHLASNLGIVELTVALHKVFDTTKDRIIFDVGHQSYVHKILTGRADQFDTLRQYKGLSGFPKSRESIHDAYDTGHSSTSLSAALGMATARDIKGDDYSVVAVIGDGSMTGGIVYEALNNIGASQRNVNIILNDNGMSISKNVGAMSRHLSHLRTSNNYLRAKENVRSTLNHIPVIGSKMSSSLSRTKEKIKFTLLDEQGILFEDLGIKYLGPIDGYDLEALIDAIRLADEYDGPTIVHVITTKGKGYQYSEEKPNKFHGIAPFNPDNGNLLSSSNSPSYSKMFGDKLVELARKDNSIAAITAAMGEATGLGPFSEEFPDRFFDVGIAEGHAVVFAAGLAKSGITPVVAIYSSFLQRAYDHLIEDICLQNLHVVFAIDRAGLVGADGETHHGQFDLSYLTSIPNMKVLCPADGTQLQEMLEYALNYDGPIAIRYPRGSSAGNHEPLAPYDGSNQVLSTGTDITVLAVGAMLDEAIKAVEELRFKGYSVGLQNINTVKPFAFDPDSLHSRLVITLEDNAYMGGYGEMFASMNTSSHFDVLTFAIPDSFIEQGSVDQLRRECGISYEDIVKGALEYFERKA